MRKIILNEYIYQDMKIFSICAAENAKIVQRPSIWVIDLKTDNVLSRYEIPPPSSGSGFASITIDVIDCDLNSFAYLPDLLASQILVYDLSENRSYLVNHNFLHMHPFQGKLSSKLSNLFLTFRFKVTTT